MPPMQPGASYRVPLGHPDGRRRLAWSCVTVGVSPGVVATVGIAGTATDYLIVDRVTRHMDIAVLLTLALFLLSACLAPVSGGWRAPARAIVAGCLAASWLGAAVLTLLMADDEESRYVSPDGSSVLVVTRGAAMIDPVWDLSVRQSSWLVARSWPLGCLNGDDPDNGLESIRWISPTKIEVTTGSGLKYLVTIDPRDSRPSRTVSVGCYHGRSPGPPTTAGAHGVTPRATAASKSSRATRSAFSAAAAPTGLAS